MTETEALLTFGGPLLVLLHLFVTRLRRIKCGALDITFKDDK